LRVQAANASHDCISYFNLDWGLANHRTSQMKTIATIMLISGIATAASALRDSGFEKIFDLIMSFISIRAAVWIMSESDK
jgi:hypothetical protein